MPVTTKKKNYIVMEDGNGYREIAAAMTAIGDPMNHATARQRFFNALKCYTGMVLTSSSGDHVDVDEFLSTQENVDMMTELLTSAFCRIKEEQQVSKQR
jgi:hypothetical protein